jgi:hypothetical protein
LRLVIVLVCLGVTYVLGYGWLLQTSNYVPYVTDNNESFSVLMHASNLYNFGLDKSFGLTDESFSPDAAAHPYVYTHGGNFPRLYGYLLYLLGVRSIESQIVVATFTIGALGMLALFSYFYRVAGLRFATLAALIFGTDYLFFAQWQVNSYRVWHTVFVFGAVLAVHGILGSRRWLWLAVMYVLYVCLFYFDITFAVFVSVLGGLYALWHLRRQRLRLIGAWTVQVVGAVTSLSILGVQDLLYMGPSAFLQDIAQTYSSRNNDVADPAAANQHLADLVQFYARQHIVFWEQFGSADPVRDPVYFLRAFFGWSMEPMTPFLSATVLALLTAILVVALYPAIGGWWGRHISIPARFHVNHGLLIEQRLVLVGAALGIAVFSASYALAQVQPSVDEQSVLSSIFWTLAAFASALGVCLVASQFHWTLPGLPNGRLASTLVGLGIIVVIAGGANLLYDKSYESLALLNAWIPEWLTRSAALVTVILAALLMLCGTRHVLGSYRAEPVLIYLACAAAGFTVTYFILPGYVLSEYLTRMTPLVVYIRDVAVVLAVDLVLAALIHSTRGIRGFREVMWPMQGRAVISVGLAGLSLFLLLGWLGIQWQYMSLMPPTSLSFYAGLEQPPFKGASFALRMYAAPVSAATGQWAYFDQLLYRGGAELTDSGYAVTGDTHTYLWFADRESNPAYAKPDYYLCFAPQYLDTAVERLNGQPETYCSTLPLVRDALANPEGFPRDRVVARDNSGGSQWAIVKLDWDYPPYLRRLPGTQSSRYVQVESDYQPTAIHVYPRFDAQQQDGVPQTDPSVRVYWTSAANECLLYAGNDASGIDLPLDFWGLIRIAVAPRTADMDGEEYSSDPVLVGLTTFQLPDTLHGGVQAIQAPSLEVAEQSALAAGTWNPKAGTYGDSTRVSRAPTPPPPAGSDGRCAVT